MKKWLLLLICCIVVYASAQTRTDSVHVAHYAVQLDVSDFTTHHVIGKCELQVVVLIPNLTFIDLDLLSLQVDSVLVDSNFSPFFSQSPHLRIPVSGYTVGDTVAVTVFYGGVPQNDNSFGGFYFYPSHAFNIGVSFTEIPHNCGRYWYPCLDVFDDKATYSFNIITENTKKAICGGLLTDSSVVEGNKICWQWQLNQPVPTYLTSVAVGDFQHYADTFHGINAILPIDIYALPDNIQNVSASFINLKTILRRYETLFGPYAFDRVGYVVLQLSGGAMEHATNIAYPRFAVDGSLTYQSLFAHELAHSWFGNPVTCDKAQEMWINEGFATFCESVVAELFAPEDNPETNGYDVSIRNLHRSVLKNCARNDHGYYPLTAVPQDVTYGTTSYDKGALVVHTLRGYMGDSLFYSGIRSMLQHFAYRSVNSQQLFNWLSFTTGLALNDFFEGWVNQPGYLHFSVDSVRAVSSSASLYNVYLRQRLCHAVHYADNNKVDITFFDNNGTRYSVNDVSFSGERGVYTTFIPFEPAFAVLDPDEKLADAVIDYNKIITRSGTYNFPDADNAALIDAVSDSVFYRVEHNLVAPDSMKTSSPHVYKLADNHYWRIEYSAAGNFSGTLRFRYSAGNSTHLDYDWLQGYSYQNLILLYRRDCSEDWQLIDFVRSGSSIGTLSTTCLRPGEYTLAVGDNMSKIANIENIHIELFPNPSKDVVFIRHDNSVDNVEIIDFMGRKLLSKRINQSDSVDMKKFASGIYFFNFYDKKHLVKTMKISKL